MDIDDKIKYEFRAEKESDRLLARLILAQSFTQGKKHCIKVLTDVLEAVDTSTAYNKVEKEAIKKNLYNDFFDLQKLSKIKGGYDE